LFDPFGRILGPAKEKAIAEWIPKLLPTRFGSFLTVFSSDNHGKCLYATVPAVAGAVEEARYQARKPGR
jgi:hypothetical protein